MLFGKKEQTDVMEVGGKAKIELSPSIMTEEKLDLSVSPVKTFVKSFLLPGLLFGLTMGLYSTFTSGIFFGIILGLITGVLFGLAMGTFLYFVNKGAPSFFFSTNLNLSQNEKILAETPVKHIEHKIAIGGKLFVTNLGLRFIPHKLNIGGSPVFIPYLDIQKAYKTKIEPSGIFSGGLVHRLGILTKDQTENLFVINEDLDKLVDYISGKIRV